VWQKRKKKCRERERPEINIAMLIKKKKKKDHCIDFTSNVPLQCVKKLRNVAFFSCEASSSSSLPYSSLPSSS